MKKVKFYLPIAAIVMAVGLAFASSERADALEDYYIQLPGECRQVSTICDGSGAVCTYAGQPVFDLKSSPTQCNIQLERNP